MYSLTVTTPDEEVATVRRTTQSTFVVAQGEDESRVALVRVELRICEECQKSKRKSKLAVGTGLLGINFQSSSRVVAGGGGEDDAYGNKYFEGGASEVVGELKTTVTSQRAVTDMDKWLFRPVPDQQESTLAETSTSTTFSTRYMQPHVVWIGDTTKAARGTTYDISSSTATTAMTKPSLNTPLSTARPTAGLSSKGEGQKRSYGNMLDSPNSPSNKDIPKTSGKEPPKSRTPKVIESDLIRTFKAMSDLEIGMYALVGVSCVAILAFLLNCASYNLCFRNHKTPIQAAPVPSGDPKDHKHDWVWLGSNNHNTTGPGAPGAPVQVSTLKREPHRPLESHHSMDSIGHRSMENTLPTVSAPAVPERTATLGRSRSSSQQQFQGKIIDPMANRSATLLARPHRDEPLHSPTSKRNQVQFTTFTTLDIKHLAALKKNGVDLNWANQQAQQQRALAGPQTPLPDIPWPVVKPLGEAQ